MDLIDLADHPPPIRIQRGAIGAVRPACCIRCGAVASGGRLAFHGHGARDREAVLPGQHWQGEARIVIIEVRRFLCTTCGATRTVLPRGLLPKHLYSLFAIVHAWWLAVPIGEALDDPAVCARQGVDRLPKTAEEHRTGRRRWTSLRRWSARIGDWWPTVPVAGGTWRERVGSLLASFVGTAAEAGVAGFVRRGVRRHAGAGPAM